MSTQLATYKTWDVTPNNIRPDVSATIDVDTTIVSSGGLFNITIRQHTADQEDEFVLSVCIDKRTAYDIVDELENIIAAKAVEDYLAK